jgi:hypothetical protein
MEKLKEGDKVFVTANTNQWGVIDFIDIKYLNLTTP